MKSRQASAAATSTSALAVASRASLTASPGRSSVLDGMQAQYEHSPPTSSRSTIATFSPPSERTQAQCSPGDPPPRTITSKSLISSSGAKTLARRPGCQDRSDDSARTGSGGCRALPVDPEAVHLVGPGAGLGYFPGPHPRRLVVGAGHQREAAQVLL